MDLSLVVGMFGDESGAELIVDHVVGWGHHVGEGTNAAQVVTKRTKRLDVSHVCILRVMSLSERMGRPTT